jgi:DNA-directed RNA polymerase subunit K/omega
MADEDVYEIAEDLEEVEEETIEAPPQTTESDDEGEEEELDPTDEEGLEAEIVSGAARSKDTSILVLPPSKHMTPNIISDYEKAAILSVRSEQIAQTGTVFLPDGVARCSADPVKLAEQEFECGMTPLFVRRVRSHCGHGGQTVVEDKRVRDCIYLNK